MLLQISILIVVISVNVSGDNLNISSSQDILKPLFVKVPPKNLYVTPSEPVIVECIAKRSTVLHINCLNDPGIILKTSTASLLDQTKESFYFKQNKKNSKEHLNKISKSVQGHIHAVNLTLREKTVESWFVRQFWCRCEAAYQHNQATTHDYITSHKSYIEISYIDKIFKREPYSAALYLGRYAKLTCIAPDGNPKPKIYWRKNGKKLIIMDNNKIQVSDDGSLVMFSTSPGDNGIYQCVAFNNAGERVSNEAKLEVLESDDNGEWLPWTPWNACPSHCIYGQYCIDECMKYLRRRSRLCRSTEKDKMKCTGPSLQTESCANVCRVDGEWSSWSDWSLCQRDCTKKRTRVCNNPVPQSGGNMCVPKSQYIITTNCSVNSCSHLDTPIYQNKLVFRDMIVYVVLSAALFLLIITASVVIFLQKKQFMSSTRSQFWPGKIDNDKAQFILLKSVNGKEMQHKDSNSESVGTINSTSCNNSPFPMKDNSLNNDSTTSTICANQPLDNIQSMEIVSRNTMASKQVSFKPWPISCHYREVDLSLAINISQYQLSHYQSITVPIVLPTLTEDDKHFKTVPVTNSGGKVVLGSTGVSVTIMPDTFNTNDTVFIDLTTKHCDDKLNQFVNYTQLSSLIICSITKDVQLKKPIIFTFPHCIAWKSLASWEINVVQISSNLKWEVVLTMDTSHQSNSHIYCHFDEELCYLMTLEWFSFCLLGKSISGRPLEKCTVEIKSRSSHKNDFETINFCQPIVFCDKRLCIVSFMEPTVIPYQLQLSCYIFIDTKDTRDYLISKITAAGCRIFDAPKVLYLKESRDNVYMYINCSSVSWRVYSKHQYQEINFSDFWNIGSEPYVIRNIMVEFSELCIEPFNGIITFYQKNCYKDKVELSVIFNITEITSQTNTIPLQIVPNHTLCKIIAPSKTFRLPRATIRQLANYLDPPKLSVPQWLMIAKQLGITSNLEYFLNQYSPTTYLMMLWEAKNREETALIDLKSTLRVIGFVDIANVLK